VTVEAAIDILIDMRKIFLLLVTQIFFVQSPFSIADSNTNSKKLSTVKMRTYRLTFGNNDGIISDSEKELYKVLLPIYFSQNDNFYRKNPLYKKILGQPEMIQDLHWRVAAEGDGWFDLELTATEDRHINHIVSRLQSKIYTRKHLLKIELVRIGNKPCHRLLELKSDEF
jgi:hypothetical protein